MGRNLKPWIAPKNRAVSLYLSTELVNKLHEISVNQGKSVSKIVEEIVGRQLLPHK